MKNLRDTINWARLLAFVTRLVNQKSLLQNEYLAAESRILRAQLPADSSSPIRRGANSPRSETTWTWD